MEEQLLAWLAERIPSHRGVPLGPGDDAAAIDLRGGPAIATVDMITDGVDFLLEEHELRRIGRKAIAINLSDIAAMAARPVAALASVALPHEMTLDGAKQLVEGMLDVATQFDTALAGGDVGSWDDRLAISVTLLGAATENGLLRRDGGRPGDRIFVTGHLGGSILGHHFDFTPRIEEALLLNARYKLSAGMDISDGLSIDLSRLAKKSGVGAQLDLSRVPIADAARQLDDDASPLEHALGDGEDFELLFTASPDQAERIAAERPLDPLGVELTEIGRLIDEPGLWALDESDERVKLDITGWRHDFGG